MLTFTNGRVGPPYFVISAVNEGSRDVTVTSLGLSLPGGATLARFETTPFLDTALPARLADGGIAEVHFSYLGVGEALKSAGVTQIMPFAMDSTGRRYNGKPVDLNPDELIEMSA